jgi:hypothetical protein
MKELYNPRLSHYMKTKFKGNILDGIAESDSDLRSSNECAKLDVRELFSKKYMTELCLSVHISSYSALCGLCCAALLCSALLCPALPCPGPALPLPCPALPCPAPAPAPPCPAVLLCLSVHLCLGMSY